jgi:ApaG protein
MMEAFFPYAETTNGIVVRVSVAFLADQSEPDRGKWVWAYHIRIENGREAPVQLLSRRWLIVDGRGATDSREGQGVIGEQPVIQPGTAYDYVSGHSLSTSTGSMEGAYILLDSDGAMIEVKIPRFALIAAAVSG